MPETASIDVDETTDEAVDAATALAEANAAKTGPAAAPVAEMTRAKSSGAYTSGFCGGTSVNGVFITNPEKLHKLCSGIGGLCSCKCHQDVAVWEGVEERFADAKAGRRVAPNPHVKTGSGGKGSKRSVAKRKS